MRPALFTSETPSVAMPTPATEAGVAEALRACRPLSRRSFLGTSAAVAGTAGVLASASTANAAAAANTFPTPPQAVLQFYFREIANDEANHVTLLKGSIQILGGTPRPKPTFQNLTATSVNNLIAMAVAFENTGVHAYYGASAYISNPNVLEVAASFLAVEAYHSGFLNSIGGQALIPGGLPYITGYSVSQVLAAAGSFVLSLNDGGAFPATFSTTEKSIENDIAILNFALLLEYLESSFYAANAATYYPG